MRRIARRRAATLVHVRVLLLVALSCAGMPLAAQSYAYPLGRLFLTPQQRDALDAQARAAARSRGGDGPGATQASNGAGGNSGNGGDGGNSAAAGAGGARLQFDGWLRRSDGPATIWLNAQPLTLPRGGGASPLGPIEVSERGALLRAARGPGRLLAPGPRIGPPASGAPPAPAESTSAALGATDAR